jgi:RNA polymerase sigma-70 factor (ECF subfamily)
MSKVINLTEKQLVKSLKKGDLRAFDELYKIYSSKLLYFTLGYVNTNEDAEDLVQEVFLTIWRKHKKIKEEHSFQSYLFTITFNAIKKYFRKKGVEKKQLDLFLKSKSTSSNNVLSKVEFNDLTDQVEKIIDTFPERRKEIFRLSRESHLSNQEIADKLDITKKTVENHITTSLKDLRERLDIHLFFLICLFLF